MLLVEKIDKEIYDHYDISSIIGKEFPLNDPIKLCRYGSLISQIGNLPLRNNFIKESLLPQIYVTKCKQIVGPSPLAVT